MIRRRSILALPALALRASTEPEEILLRAGSFDFPNYRALWSYVWISEERATRGKRLVQQQKFEVNLLSGSMYWRKLEHKEKPLRGKEKEAEDVRYERHVFTAPFQNLFAELGWRQERAFFERLSTTHSIQRFADQPWNGLPCHYFSLEPHRELEGYAPSFHIEVWLDQSTLHWVHSKWTARRNVKWRLHQMALGRLSLPYSNNITFIGQFPTGTQFEWTLTRVSPEPDAPWSLQEFLTRRGSYQNSVTCSGFRKYTADSELIL